MARENNKCYFEHLIGRDWAPLILTLKTSSNYLPLYVYTYMMSHDRRIVIKSKDVVYFIYFCAQCTFGCHDPVR